MDKFDVIIIGAGPAGYVAAIRCAQLGLKTLCVEKWGSPDKKQILGGTCLNVGCIPSKALLESSHKYEMAHGGLTQDGIDIKEVSLNLSVMLARKEKVVKKLIGGIAMLFKTNGVQTAFGTGRLLRDKQVEVSDMQGKKTLYAADHIVLASGSVPVEIPSAPLYKDIVTDSTGALEFDKVPSSLCVIGAGIIGLELGSVWGRLGSKVTLLEAMPNFLPMVDKQISKDAARHYKMQGLDIKLGCKVTGVKPEKKQAIVSYAEGEKEQTLTVDKVVVAVGRKPYSEKLLASDCGISLDERGFIPVDEQCRTSADNIYAVGDLVRGPMLAHKSSEEGIMVAELIAGKTAEINYNLVPNVVYTSPEIAWVGLTEEQAVEQGKEYKTGSFPFAASGRAMANNDIRGMVKIIADKKSDEVLGVHIIGNQAGELIAQAVVAMEFMSSAEDLQLTMFAHPTLSEALHEAAFAVDGRAIHMVNPKR